MGVDSPGDGNMVGLHGIGVVAMVGVVRHVVVEVDVCVWTGRLWDNQQDGLRQLLGRNGGALSWLSRRGCAMAGSGRLNVHGQPDRLKTI